MRGDTLRIACVLALLASRPPNVAQAQTAPADATALRQDMQAVRRSVDALVDIMKQFVAEAGKRERAALLLRRLELAEQQAARLASDLQSARGALDVSQRTVERSRNRVQSARSMEQVDRTGAAAPLLAPHPRPTGVSSPSVTVAHAAVSQCAVRMASVVSS